MSGDSEVGNSTFEMNGGSLTAKNGGMFYTTNTESTIILSDVDITYADDNDFFLKCTGNSNQRGWGESGNNGADCLFTATKQEMQGDVVWDSISQLDFYMTDGSTLTGAVTDDESNAGEGGDGYGNLYIGEDCTWTVTGDNDICIASRSGSSLCAGSDLFQDGIPTGGREYPETETLYHRREPRAQDTTDDHRCKHRGHGNGKRRIPVDKEHSETDPAAFRTGPAARDIEQARRGKRTGRKMRIQSFRSCVRMCTALRITGTDP